MTDYVCSLGYMLGNNSATAINTGVCAVSVDRNTLMIDTAVTVAKEIFMTDSICLLGHMLVNNPATVIDTATCAVSADRNRLMIGTGITAAKGIFRADYICSLGNMLANNSATAIDAAALAVGVDRNTLMIGAAMTAAVGTLTFKYKNELRTGAATLSTSLNRSISPNKTSELPSVVVEDKVETKKEESTRSIYATESKSKASSSSESGSEDANNLTIAQGVKLRSSKK